MEQIKHTELKTLKDFYALMTDTREVRFEAVATLLAGGKVDGSVIQSLSNALDSLEDVPEIQGKRVLSLDGPRSVNLDMDYEINELRKDIFYLCLLYTSDAADEEDSLDLRSRRFFITKRAKTGESYKIY
eukprot:TRINITY_DN19190_c0_g1_i1.p2 TRINITY_DN19190_c0_g1~~TRINITY_DN19190_c0_g1_i1.p2  ORF type:complete len:130 (-),score=23.30 TRINITY_DN19190_c0_g1_i1:46-435(-)